MNNKIKTQFIMKIRKQNHDLLKRFNNVSKTLKTFFGTFVMTSALLTSCQVNDDADIIFEDIPSAQEFAGLRDQALEDITQDFLFNADDGSITLTTDNGVTITINATCLTKDGNAVTGMVNLEYVELFEKGNMLTTNKPTMGIMPNGDKALLISGGEFFIEATQNGVALETNCPIQLNVPANLTGGPDNDMILWNGIKDENGDLVWDEARDAAGQDGVFAEGGEYYAFVQQFGWTNIDRFYNDPRPKTTIYAQAPEGYNYTNSAIYLSYDGEDSGLATLDTYENGVFSEHYGQIPIGLECHVIFVTEDNGIWRYAIKPVTIAADDIITFSLGETITGTEATLIDLINGLP